MEENWYEINRRQEDGTLDSYEMVRAKNLNDAVKNELGEDAKDYTITRSRVNGKVVITAKCPEQTAGHIEVFKAGGQQ